MREGESSVWPNHRLSRFVAAGGIRWHVQQAGEGESMLLIHGTGSSAHSWRDVLPTLALRYNVLAVDLPGHGASGAIAVAGRSIDGMGKALCALLRAIDFRPQYCVGHSAGAVILCRMAIDGDIDPHVIVSINGAFVPLGGAARLVFSPLAKVMSRSSLLPRLLSNRAGRADNVARMLAATGSTLDAQGVELYGRLVRDPRHVAGALGMMSEWNLPAFYRQLPQLRTPLVLVAAVNDRTVPARQAYQVKEQVPHATIRLLPELGHLAHEEQPQLLAEIIIEFCRERASA